MTYSSTSNKTVADYLNGRENNFDIIRFIAALMVVAKHSYHFVINDEDPLLKFTNDTYDYGKIGVATFFIISGLLVSQSYGRSRNVYEYFIARALRIYPALIFVVLFSVYILGPVFTTYEVVDYFLHPQTFEYLIFNSSALIDRFLLPGVFENNPQPGVINGSLWTLSNEVACYILVAVVGLYRSKKVLASIGLFMIFILIFRYKFTFGTERFLINALCFVSGSLTYHFREKIKLNNAPFAIALVVLVVNVLFNPELFSSTLITIISLTYVILFIAFKRTSWFKDFTKHGDFSYGLYIWGWPVQQVISVNFPYLTTPVFFVFSFTITFVFAYLSWHLIERKALKLKNVFIGSLRGFNSLPNSTKRNIYRHSHD